MERRNAVFSKSWPHEKTYYLFVKNDTCKMVFFTNVWHWSHDLISYNDLAFLPVAVFCPIVSVYLCHNMSYCSLWRGQIWQLVSPFFFYGLLLSSYASPFHQNFPFDTFDYSACSTLLYYFLPLCVGNISFPSVTVCTELVIVFYSITRKGCFMHMLLPPLWYPWPLSTSSSIIISEW